MAFASDKGRQGSAGVSTGGYTIDNSLRFNDNDSAYLSRTPASAGNRKTWTWSGWVKRGNISVDLLLFEQYNSTDDWQRILINTGNEVQTQSRIGNVNQDYLWTSRLLRDASAWYHIVLVADTTLSTADDRMKIYINGSQETSFGGRLNPSQNYDGWINTTEPAYIGKSIDATGDGYLAEVNFVDGQALTPSDFGETDEDYGHWKAKAYAGTYGTNGFYLNFKNSGSLGNDANGSNNWTPTNLAATDQMLDSPTNNFATMNPLDLDTPANTALFEGNLQYTGGNGSGLSTVAIPSSGKWYFEYMLKSYDAGQGWGGYGGISNQDRSKSIYFFSNSNYAPENAIYKNGSVNQTISGASSVGDVLGVEVDQDGSTIQFYRNGSALGTSITIDAVEYLIRIGGNGATYNANVSNIANFGQDSSFAGNKTAQGNADSNGIGDFYYSPPTGFLALCTQNLPEPTVVPSEHFNTVLWTGNGGTQSITGVGFAPDFTWLKRRTEAEYHGLFDKVRGATKWLTSSDTPSEFTTTNSLTSFDSDGFSLGNYSNFNYSGSSFVAWNWKANGTGVSNTNGSITSTVSANADAGFSIVSYTGTGVLGATVGHGLTVSPEMVIVKTRSGATQNWCVFSEPVGNTGTLYLNRTNATDTNINFWNNTSPTASVFSIGGDSGDTGRTSDTYIAYCFHSVEGYSKVGSYTGNGSSDGTFVHCGFKPAYILVKPTASSTHHWWIHDTARNPINPSTKQLRPNSSGAEYDDATYTALDIVSNGFKWRTSESQVNGAVNFIFLAFAEHPFKYSTAR